MAKAIAIPTGYLLLYCSGATFSIYARDQVGVIWGRYLSTIYIKVQETLYTMFVDSYQIRNSKKHASAHVTKAN